MPHTFNILDHGALADGQHDDAPAIQRAIDAAHAAGGGRVLLPRGAIVRAGSFVLRSRVQLHLDRDAILLSATTLDAFPQRVFDFGDEADKRVWIRARDADDVTLSGSGTIDGQCHAFALGQTEHIFRPTVRWRPATTCFENCRRVTVRELRFRNAANWTLHFVGCRDVHVHDVHIDNDLRFPNADGIDPDHCKRVRIERCRIVSADDCIVLKNTAPFSSYGDCEDIEVCDCVLESASAAFKIGSESCNGFRRIRVRDCRIERSHRGLAIQLRDGGDVEDVRFERISVNTRRFSPDWWGAGEAIYVTALRRNDRTRVGRVRDVHFEDISCTVENGVVIYADPPGQVDDLALRRVRVAVERVTDWPSGLFDLRPCPAGYLPPGSEPAGDDTPWGRPASRPPAIFSIEGAGHVRFEDVAYSQPGNDSRTWMPLRSDGTLRETPRPLDPSSSQHDEPTPTAPRVTPRPTDPEGQR